MTKKLEDLFDLADPVEAEEFYESRDKKATPVIEDVAPMPVVEEQQVIAEAPVTNVVDMSDRINTSLTHVDDIHSSDPDMDRYADKAEKAFEDLMDLGFNVEDRNAGKIFEAASSVLKTAVDAKNAKADRKLKAIEMQLKKMRLDQNIHKMPKVIEQDAEYVVSDRNSMLSALSQNKDK
jgi:hypothetical protein|tara:strand:- start:2318 stop:2854 length:537 start_codon:yes stop_codon:yes gene_type:complete